MARNKREPGAGGGETGEGVGTPAERQGEQQSGSRDVRAFSATVRCQISGEHKWLGLPLRVLADQIEGTAARRSPT